MTTDEKKREIIRLVRELAEGGIETCVEAKKAPEQTYHILDSPEPISYAYTLIHNVTFTEETAI